MLAAVVRVSSALYTTPMPPPPSFFEDAVMRDGVTNPLNGILLRGDVRSAQKLKSMAQALATAKRAAHLKLVGLNQPAPETANGPL
jgi:hypothetical protein